MEQKALDFIGFVAIAVIVVSVAVIGFETTGRVTDWAQVNVTVTNNVAINFTTDSVNWGSGFVNTSSQALLNTSGWVVNGTWSSVSNHLVLENNGNVDINLTLRSSDAAAAMIGGTSPAFQYKIENNTANACQNQSSGVSWTNFLTSDVLVCGNITPTADTIDIPIQLIIPSDAVPEAKGAIITATGLDIT